MSTQDAPSKDQRHSLKYSLTADPGICSFPSPTHDPDEGSFSSAHGAFLVHPETLAESLLQDLAGTVLGQIRF